MSKSVKNGIGLRKELQARGLGLNTSNSWVIKTLDGDELDYLQRVNFQALSWQDEECVLIVRGTEKCGLSVRFVQLSRDGRYCRFHREHPVTYLSPRLLRAEPMSLREFVASIIHLPTARIFKSKRMREFTGILVGARDAQYKSLVTLDGDKLISLLVEENPKAPQYQAEDTRILEDNPATGEAVRTRMLALFA